MAALPPSPPGHRTPLRVLVIDDNVDGAEALCALLALMGCTTAVAFGGAQGLALAATFEPQLALVDLEMPDMSGCEVAQRLRAGPPPSLARLVCLTGRGAQEDRRLCIDAGFDEFFTKPLQPGQLAALLATAARPAAGGVFATQPSAQGDAP